MNQNQSDEVRSSTTTGECDDTYLPVRPWEDMSSSQVPPPSCGQPLLRVATQQNAPEPMPLCAQPRSSVFTQNSTQSSFMPTQPNNSESFTSTAPPRLLPRMFTQTQDYIKEDGFDISRLSGLDDVFADPISTPPRRMGPPPMNSYMGSLKARKNVGRLSPMVPQHSQVPHMEWDTPSYQVPASTSAQPTRRLASRSRYPHLHGAMSSTQPMAGEEIVEVPVGKVLDLNSDLKLPSLVPVMGYAPLMGSDNVEPMSYRKLLGHPELMPRPRAVPGASTSFQRAKMLINQAAATEGDGQLTPAKRGAPGRLSNAQKKVKLAAMNRHANNEESVVPETPFKM